MRTAARVDANQKRIVAALRKVGATVQHLHRLGKGCPDLLVGWQGQNILMEVKDGSKPPSAQKLTPDEVKWCGQWRGRVLLVRDASEAVVLLTQAVRRG